MIGCPRRTARQAREERDENSALDQAARVLHEDRLARTAGSRAPGERGDGENQQGVRRDAEPKTHAGGERERGQRGNGTKA